MNEAYRNSRHERKNKYVLHRHHLVQRFLSLNHATDMLLLLSAHSLSLVSMQAIYRVVFKGRTSAAWH